MQAPIRGKPGVELELVVTYLNGRKHLPIVGLRRGAYYQRHQSASPR